MVDAKVYKTESLTIFFSGGLSEILTMIEGEMNGNKFNKCFRESNKDK